MKVENGKLIYVMDEVPHVRAMKQQFQLLYWAWIDADYPQIKEQIANGELGCQFQVGIT